jgi:hypothetical protein
MKKNIKFWALHFFLFSFFMCSFNNLYSNADQQHTYAKILGASSIGISILSLFLGSAFYTLANHNEKDIPVTHEEEIFFVLRNFLPKEELDRYLVHKKNVAEKQKRIGVAFFGISLTCFAIVFGLGCLQNFIANSGQEK